MVESLSEEFVMENMPWESWNSNVTYAIEDGETLVFNAQGDGYSLIPDGSVFKLKME